MSEDGRASRGSFEREGTRQSLREKLVGCARRIDRRGHGLGNFAGVIQKLGRGFVVEAIAAIEANEIITLRHHVGNLPALRAVQREQDVVGHGGLLGWDREAIPQKLSLALATVSPTAGVPCR